MAAKQGLGMWLKNIGLMTSFYTVSEAFQQKYVLKREKIDWGEVVRLGVAVGCWSAPVNCLWYFKILDKVVPNGVNPVKTVITRSFVDSIVILPVSATGLYTILDTLAGKEDRLEQVKSKLVKTCVTGCMFWIPAQMINFRFLPVHLRVVYVSVTSFAWSNILCYIKNSDTGKTPLVQTEKTKAL